MIASDIKQMARKHMRNLKYGNEYHNIDEYEFESFCIQILSIDDDILETFFEDVWI